MVGEGNQVHVDGTVQDSIRIMRVVIRGKLIENHLRLGCTRKLSSRYGTRRQGTSLVHNGGSIGARFFTVSWTRSTIEVRVIAFTDGR